MLKDGYLQNLSQVGLNMCFTADFIEKVILNIFHWDLLAWQKCKKRDFKAEKI